jgi:hypothetical protein
MTVERSPLDATAATRAAATRRRKQTADEVKGLGVRV